MGHYLDGGGYSVDDVEFKIYIPGGEVATLGGCASCKLSHTRPQHLALWVDFDHTGYLVEVCQSCAARYYPEAVMI